MSVNPKWNIVGAERDESVDPSASDNPECELTPELLAIADRLTAEAADLAARFPAKQMVAVRSIAARWKIAAAAVLVGITASSAVFGWWLRGSITVAKAEPGRAVAEVAQSDLPRGVSDLRSSPESFTNSAGVQEVGYALAAPQSSKLSEFDMLRIQLSAFEQVIHRLQDELARRAKSEADTAKTIGSLSREIELLRQQLQSQSEPQQDAAATSGHIE
jgi:hypothetical protein